MARGGGSLLLRPKCEATTRAGQCKRDAISGQNYCYSHSPQFTEARHENAIKAARIGGRGRSKADQLFGTPLESVITDLLGVREEAKRIGLELRRGTITPFDAHARIAAGNLQIRANEAIINVLVKLQGVLTKQDSQAFINAVLWVVQKHIADRESLGRFVLELQAVVGAGPIPATAIDTEPVYELADNNQQE